MILNLGMAPVLGTQGQNFEAFQRKSTGSGGPWREGARGSLGLGPEGGVTRQVGQGRHPEEMTLNKTLNGEENPASGFKSHTSSPSSSSLIRSQGTKKEQQETCFRSPSTRGGSQKLPDVPSIRTSWLLRRLPRALSAGRCQEPHRGRTSEGAGSESGTGGLVGGGIIFFNLDLFLWL